MDCVLQMHRQRYLAFAKSAVQRTLPPLPSQSVIEQLKLKYPSHFEVVRRISQVHRDVFKSSAVRLTFFSLCSWKLKETLVSCTSSVLG
jgi:hypothetical protein